METRKSVRRIRFEEDSLPHLDALWSTALWLTKRSSSADQLVTATMAQAYLLWPEDTNFTASKILLFRILTREFSNSHRQRPQPDQVSPKPDSPPADNGNGHKPNPVAPLDRRDLIPLMGISDMLVKGTIARLRPLSRLIMLLHLHERFSSAEIAFVTDLRRDTVKAILCRLRRQIPSYLLQYTDSLVTAADTPLKPPRFGTASDDR